MVLSPTITLPAKDDVSVVLVAVKYSATVSPTTLSFAYGEASGHDQTAGV